MFIIYYIASYVLQVIVDNRKTVLLRHTECFQNILCALLHTNCSFIVYQMFQIKFTYSATYEYYIIISTDWCK